MGEIAEMTLDGTLCQECGAYIGEPCGYPRSCEDCEAGLDFPWAMKLVKEGIEQIEIEGNKKQRQKLINYLYKKIRELKAVK
nr:MAG TPA: DNA directed RNA polymerase, 7 kDa subunit [Caudoviricetes sp.]